MLYKYIYYSDFQHYLDKTISNSPIQVPYFTITLSWLLTRHALIANTLFSSKPKFPPFATLKLLSPLSTTVNLHHLQNLYGKSMFLSFFMINI